MASRFSRPPCCIRNPLAGLAAVVAVQHRRHRVYAQSIDAIALQPVQRIGDEKVAHFGAAEVVDQRVPVLVKTFARVGIFVQMRAVEIGEAVSVAGEVRGYPVEQKTHAARMTLFYEAQEAGTVAETRCRRIQADALVAP